MMASSRRTSRALLESILSLSPKVASATDSEPHRDELWIPEDANAKPNLDGTLDFASQRCTLWPHESIVHYCSMHDKRPASTPVPNPRVSHYKRTLLDKISRHSFHPAINGICAFSRNDEEIDFAIQHAPTVNLLYRIEMSQVKPSRPECTLVHRLQFSC